MGRVKEINIKNWTYYFFFFFFFFCCVFISDLYLFQDIVSWILASSFLKKNMLFMDKVTTGTLSLVLVIMKFNPIIVLWCSIKMQSRSTKSKDSQKLLRYLSGIVTSTFKDGTGSCSGWSAFLLDFQVLLLFLFYIRMIYHLKHYRYHQLHQFCLCNNSTNFLM